MRFLKNFYFLTIFTLVLNGCAFFQATGDTIEAVGEGAGTALVGMASGTGHAIAGTGRAIANAAGSSGESMADFQPETQTNSNDKDLVF
jgi:hypothetical protein